MKPRCSHLRPAAFTSIAAALSLLTPAHADTETWSGNTNGTWDTTTANWFTDGSNDLFESADDALFTGTPANNVTAATGLTIGAITLDNTFTGSVTMSGANTVSGATTISSGTLNLNNATGLGTSAITVNNGGILNLSGGNATYANAVSGAGVANVTTNPAGDATLTGAWSGFTGTLNLNGSGNFKTRFTTTQPNVISSSATINVNAGTTLYLNQGFNYGASVHLFGAGNSENLGALRLETNANQTGSVTLRANSFLGANGGAGTISGNIGESGGSFGFTKQGNNQLTLTGSNNYSGATTISSGTLRIGDGGTTGNLGLGSVTNNATLTFNRSNDFTVTNNITSAAGTGIVRKEGAGKLTLSGTNAIGNSLFAAAGTLEISGATTIDGGAGNNLGFLTVSGNTSVTIPSGGSLGIVGTTHGTKSGTIIGQNAAGTSAVTVSGGTFAVGGNCGLSLGNNVNTAIGTLTISSGTVTVAAGSATLQNLLNFVALGRDNATGIINLDGGTLETGRQFVRDGSGGGTAGAGTATFNFNGGTLKALANQTSGNGWFETATTGNFQVVTTTVKVGGANIDTNGFNTNINAVLAHDTGLGATPDGGLTKNGTGTLTLGGANTYTGATNVNNGTLQITGASANTGAVNVNNSATLLLSGTGAVNSSSGIFVNGSGAHIQHIGSVASTVPVTLTQGTLSGNGFVGPVTVNNAAAVVSNGNANTDTLNLDSLAFTTTGTANLNHSGGFNAPLFITNNLNIGAGFTVNAACASPWTNGTTYDLISYGTLTGSPASITKGTIASLGARQNATLGNSGSAITLTISGDTPVWTGAQSGDWTTAAIGGSKNWKLQNAGTSTDFLTNDQVLFDDSATGTSDINISTANVQVASVAFNNWGVANSGLDYTISSSDGFGIADGSGPASLTKEGDGSVTLKTINSYTGSTTINAGTLQLGDGITDGDIATSSAIAIGNIGTLVFNRVGSFIYGGVISGFGAVVKNGAGTQILTGDNTMSGGVTINAGTLQIGNGGTTGSLGSSAVTTDASLVFNRSNAFTVGNVISGTGSVSQVGTGAVTFSSAFSSFSGGTTISPGSTILVGANNALGTGLVTLANGVVLGTNPGGALPNAIMAPAATTATLATSGGNLTLNGNISGSGDLNRTATGAPATVYLGGNNSGYTGTFTIENNAAAATRFTSANAGSAGARWVNNQPISGRVTAEFGTGTIEFGSLTGTGFFMATVGNATIQVGALGLNDTYSGVLNQSGPGTLAVTKVGSGTWTLTGTNTYTGDTTVNGGVLAVDGDAIPNAGKLVINGGKVQPTGTEVVDTLYFGAVQQAAGTWGATGSGAAHIDDTHFSGTGVVSVTTAPPAGYTTWADANAPGQTMDQDHDNDGVPNGIEYFMGLSGSAFTANPAPVSGVVTWPMGATYVGVYGTDYEVQTSTDLLNWTQVPVGAGDNTVTITAGSSVVYDMPTGGKSFVRLVVKN